MENDLAPLFASAMSSAFSAVLSHNSVAITGSHCIVSAGARSSAAVVPSAIVAIDWPWKASPESSTGAPSAPAVVWSMSDFRFGIPEAVVCPDLSVDSVKYVDITGFEPLLSEKKCRCLESAGSAQTGVMDTDISMNAVAANVR